MLDRDHTKALRDGVRELRLYLGETAWRITYWLPTGRDRLIVLLTVFQKVRDDSQPRDVDRAVKVRWACESSHTDPSGSCLCEERVMAGHSRWKLDHERRLREGVPEHPE
ncbi:type II toxin-antitoxin system RelE/ParE family toxin [Actinomadura scrupuli]|uniref:type II toxin-antitoxin system RelE/ParE family toxin n=1 Tax=Actinomadura scrupuli TaxID=559629 RepID=UPI003D97B01C